MSNVFTNVLFIFSIFHLVLGASNSVRTKQEDAQQVFQEFLDRSNIIMRDIDQSIRYKEWERNEELQMQELGTIYTIDKKFSEISLKISHLNTIFASWNITRCQASPVMINNYQTKLKERAQKCTNLTSDALRNLVQKTVRDMTAEQNNLMGCHSRSLSFCGSFGSNDGCYDSVIESIQAAKINMETNFELIRSNFMSKITSMKLPCQDLIEFELSVYPDYTVQYMSQCGETDMKNTRIKTCPY